MSDQTENKTLFVTGASGFIGRSLVQKALNDGYHVTAFVRSVNSLQNTSENLVVVPEYSLADQSVLLSRLDEFSPTALVHAASSKIFMGGDDSDGIQSLDLNALQQILQMLTDHAQETAIVIFGSALIYGFEGSPHLETELPRPRTLYGLNKFLCSSLAQYYRDVEKLRVTELRLFNVYGVGDRPPRLIPSCVEAALEGRAIELTAGMQQRDFIYIDDVLDIILAAVEKIIPAEIFNVSTGIATSISDVAALIVELAKVKVDVKTGSLPPRKNEYAVLTGDSNRLAHFGLAPKTALVDGLTRMILASR